MTATSTGRHPRRNETVSTVLDLDDNTNTQSNTNKHITKPGYEDEDDAPLNIYDKIWTRSWIVSLSAILTYCGWFFVRTPVQVASAALDEQKVLLAAEYAQVSWEGLLFTLWRNRFFILMNS